MIPAILDPDHASGCPENRENTSESKTGVSEEALSSKKAITRLRSPGSVLVKPQRKLKVPGKNLIVICHFHDVGSCQG